MVDSEIMLTKLEVAFVIIDKFCYHVGTLFSNNILGYCNLLVCYFNL